MHMESQDEPQRDVELELRQARSEALLAERRYAACDPDNRLIAVQLEKSWEIAFSRVKAYQARLDAARSPDPVAAAPDFAGLANDLNAAWNAPNVTMRARQQLLRALITDIIADVDEAAREVILTIHWRCGQHSQLRVRKLKSGKHGCRTSEDALAVMRGIASRWSDEDIAASLNRMEWAPVREKPGRRAVSVRCDPCMGFTPIVPPKRRVADNERSGKVAWRDQSCDPPVNGARNFPNYGEAKFPSLAGGVISRPDDQGLRFSAAVHDV
jgi:hypothetical protein